MLLTSVDVNLNLFSYICHMAAKELFKEGADLTNDQKAIHLISGIAAKYHALSSRAVSHLGISPLQVQILQILFSSGEESMTVNQIRDRITAEKPNVSRALNKLMKDQLIRKNRNEYDQRVVLVSITSRGQAMMEVAANAMADLQKLNLTASETETLVRILNRIQPPTF